MSHNKQTSYNKMASQSVRLDGKTVIITGGGAGVGKETAIDLARRGAKLIIGSRNEEKTLEAIEDIKEQSGSNDVHFIKLNLASLDSVRSFAQVFLEQHSELHILINNAGIMTTPFGRTEDGFEMQFGVNHLGHFLLTNLLLQRMLDSGTGRIISLSSSYHSSGKINFDDLNSDKGYDKFAAYGQSKLANLLFIKELARRLEGKSITAYALHPGVVKTNLFQHLNLMGRLMQCCCGCAMKTPVQGAQTSIYCAVTVGLESESGNYFADCKVKQSSPLSRNMEDAKRLWEISEELTHCKYDMI